MSLEVHPCDNKICIPVGDDIMMSEKTKQGKKECWRCLNE